MVLRKNREAKNRCSIEEGSVSRDCTDDFVKSKGVVGSNVCWKLTEVEERIFGGNFRGSCMHK